jgi:hypothetical protein
MCTATWWAEADRLELFFNRDELRSRSPAQPPEVRHAPGGTACLAPLDPDGGGTWLAVNEYGLVLALVNHFPQPSTPAPGPERISRGQLVLALADARSGAEVAARLGDTELARYEPFLLLGLGLTEPPRLRIWDGRALGACAGSSLRMPVTSSSFQTGRVIAARRRAFARATAGRVAGPETLERYHRTHDPTDPVASVLMEREDARTVATMRVQLEPGAATMRYAGRTGAAPAFEAPVESRLLLRHGAAGLSSARA